MSDPHLRLDSGVSASSGPSPPSNFSTHQPNSSTLTLTTFPNPFQDEPETGLLPSLLSKVKSTFSSAPPKDTKESAAPDKPPQSAAQQIAEATRKQHAAQAQAQAAVAASAAQASAPPSTITSHASAASVPTIASRRGTTSQLSIGPSGETSPSSLISPTAPSLNVASLPLPPRAQHSHQSSAASASQLSSASASVVSSNPQPQTRRHLVPGERNWRPAAASAQVTVSPVTSVTTTAPRLIDDSMPPPRLMNVTPTVEITNARGKPVSGSAALGGGRLRRGSIGTIPDSPSSVSLSAMISGNAELSQNSYGFVPGFQLPAEDTRSIRSLALAKRPHSVSKIIRRMRGEGLSKHYWMADENCKECYDCKSVFTTWRRKHHCRICGQIFCGRCASNIIGARRFGQDGMVRVCNLCLKIMEDYDDDDDRRSINSTMSGLAGLPDRVISPEVAFSQSPFAASQLFRSTNDSLSAIEESVHQAYGEDDSDTSDSEEHTGNRWGLWPSIAAPFRRHGDDNSDDQGQESNTHSELPSQTPSPGPGSANGDTMKRMIDFPLDSRPRIGFPRTDTIESEEGFPIINAPLHFSGLRTRLSSAASLRGGANHGLSALLDTDRKDGLWRARSYSFVTPPEFLTGPSLAHFNTMLQQSIERHELPNPETWHRVLSKLLLRVSTNLRPVVRAGDSIDVRTYVKIKKVPGGKITDSEYVDGIVITKNVAHKGMSRRLVNPRIMVITFPLDYHRVETQFMSLDPILKQENDYLRLLTNRIIDLRPHIVLVERFVSRIALEFLYKANIVVARGVKFSAIHQVARCTHADIIGSMDKLALEPRLGRCADFKVQTFEHDLIPGKRKTYMRFEGTHNGFGGTIILRGGNLTTLRRVKLIADFLALVAYHLKNETFLYGDEFQMLPPHPPMPEEYRDLLRLLADKRATPKTVYGRGASSPLARSPVSPDSELTPRAERDLSDPKELERENALQITRQIAESLEPYLTTVLSASVAVRFPPPHVLAKMAALDRKLNHLRLKKDEREAAKILEEEKRVDPPKIEPLRIVIETEEDLARKEAERKETESAKEGEKNDVDQPPEDDDKDDTDSDKGAETPRAEEKFWPKEEVKVGDKAEPVTSAQTEKEVADDAMSIKSAPLPRIDGGSAPSSAANSAFTSPVATPTATLPTSASFPILPPPTPSPTPTPATSTPATGTPATGTPQTSASTPAPQAVAGSKGGDPYRILLNPEDFVDASTLAFVEYDHDEQYKLWKHYVRRNPGPLHPKNFQGIIYLQALYRQGQDKPCVEPARQEINFYQEDDQTLGQFLGSMVANAAQSCLNPTCELLMLFHYDVLVHAERHLQIAMEHFSCPLPGHEEQILTWSYCRQCNRSWEPTVIREETWRMSWGAYLEHCFYPPETRTGFGCAHDAYREHIRYFAHHNMVVRIHNDEIELFEPVRPPIKVIWNVEDKVALKNAEYESALAKTAAFFDSVLHRLRSFTDDLVEPDKQARMRTDRDALLTRAVADRDEMVNSLKLTYKQTPPTDVLAINVVLQALQEKVIQWDLDFLDVEKLYMPSEKDLRRMTATHLKRLFATHDVFGTLDKNVAGITVPEVDEQEKVTDPESSKPPSIAPTLEPESGTTTPAPESEAGIPSPDRVHDTADNAADQPEDAEGKAEDKVENPGEGPAESKGNDKTDDKVEDETEKLEVKAENPGEQTSGSATTSSDTATPTPTMSRASGPTMLAPPETPELELAETPRDYDTDSTISAAPRPITMTTTPYRPSADLASSGMDSDTHAFVSRLPVRRHRPQPNVADLVKRFQDTVPDRSGAATPTMERPRSAAGAHRRIRHEPTDVSDSDIGRPHRPFLRRNRATEQTVVHRSSSKSNLFSDGDRSYAVNASRAVAKRTNTDPITTMRGRISRNPSPTRVNRSRGTSPSARKDGRLSVPSVPVSKSVSMDGKPRLAGKGKTPRKPPLPTTAQASPGGNLMRGIPRRVMGAGSRVTSIARHFDKISRDAERDRAKRISMARGKRAGRVGVTKARVQVFNNVRDAFKDEFDSDSSAADNEEEDADLSDVSIDSTGRAKPRRKHSSPAKPRPALLPPLTRVPPTSQPKKANRDDDETEAEIEPSATPKPQAPSAPPSTFESEVFYPETDDAGGSKIASDRLHIELAPFDTSAPLPSIPTAAGLITEDEAGKKGLSQMSQVSESEMSSGGGERSSILKTLTGLWAIRAGDFTPLDYPLSAAEHIFVDSRVIVREHEPTSIIAFTLCSKQYREQIRSVAAASKARAARAERAQHSTLPSEPSMLEEVGNERPWDLISVDELDEPSLAGAGTHLKYEFEAGSSTISCRIFFAEQFAALRQAVQCEDGFIESLARCAKFDASGGKSGSAFLKTKDDRFIVKEISRNEMDALTKFAPAYFEYTSTAFERQRPTALAKTYGIFKIGYRNGVTGRSMHMNVLVQENLFYGRHFSKIYDLKGSTRNRLIKPTGRLNEVLLDENLMEISYTSPLYLRDHSKLILRTALWNDTLFLSNLNVMDYSLVVGVDAENKELVVGVVDYIRTFTWDKKVESWVKDFGGGGRGEPTIVTPLQYRKRFRTAMERFYFPSVPDRWSHAIADEPLDEESATLLNM